MSNVKRKTTMTYNCARVYVGWWWDDTNEFCHQVECSYEVTKSSITQKRLSPVYISGKDTDGPNNLVDVFMLYPQSKTATVRITNGKRKFNVHLVKSRGSESKIYKLRLHGVDFTPYSTIQTLIKKQSVLYRLKVRIRQLFGRRR